MCGLGDFGSNASRLLWLFFDDDVVDLFAPSMVGWVAENQIIVFGI